MLSSSETISLNFKLSSAIDLSNVLNVANLNNDDENDYIDTALTNNDIIDDEIVMQENDICELSMSSSENNNSLIVSETDISTMNSSYANEMLLSIESLHCDPQEGNEDVTFDHVFVTNSELVNNDVNSTQGLINCELNYAEINQIGKDYPENIIIGHLNINSFGTKYQEVANLLKECRFDALLLSETKLDSSSRNTLYELNEYVMYRQDKRSNSGGLLAYISKNVPSTLGPLNICTELAECITIELNVKENKILIVCMYKNPKMTPNAFKLFFENICEKIFDTYEHVIIIGDLNFNMFQDNNVLKSLCPVYNLTNIIKDATCFKSNTPTLIDVMLVTKRRKFLKGFSCNVGISDFHNLVGGVMRLAKPIPKQKVTFYRKLANIDYITVNNELRNINLEEVLFQENDVNIAFNTVQNTLVEILDRHAPKKQKIIRVKDFPCMSKRLKKAILIRNQHRNKFFKFRTNQHLAQYRKHRNNVTLIKREEIKNYFKEKCDGGTKNKDFWKAIKPIFSKTKTKQENIPLRENGQIISDCSTVCNIFNKFFREIGSDIGHKEDTSKSMNNLIADYANHQSIKIISSEINQMQRNFTFSEVSEYQIMKILQKLPVKKASGYDDIPLKFIKMTSRLLSKPLSMIANKCISQQIFPENMKKANITPLYKKKDKLNKDNYRSVNLLIAMSKVLEKVMSLQIYDYFKPLFHKYLSGFRKSYGCQDILLRMTEDWRNALDNRQTVGTIAIDLSKAFDCMPHGLLIAKLNAYGFCNNACKLIKSYLVDRKQRVKIGHTFSEWVNNIKGVPQGSILGPLLFNIFINDFLFMKLNAKVYNYADDNTLSYTSLCIDEIKTKLQADCLKAIQWFKNNNMKANADKFQLMFINRNKTFNDLYLKVENDLIIATQSINILGVEVDNKLNFSSHIDQLCQQAGKQTNALKRIKYHLDKECKILIYNSYISSNYNYCPVVWMFTWKLNIDKLEKSNKRAIRFVTNDYESTYETLCRDQKFINIHARCIKAVAIQMYKIKHQTAPDYLVELFNEREINYSIRNHDKFTLPNFDTITFGRKSFKYYGAKLWNNLPIEIKDSVSLSNFKTAITTWLENLENLNSIDFF